MDIVIYRYTKHWHQHVHINRVYVAANYSPQLLAMKKGKNKTHSGQTPLAETGAKLS